MNILTFGVLLVAAVAIASSEDHKKHSKEQEKRETISHNRGAVRYGGDVASRMQISNFRRGYGSRQENSPSNGGTRNSSGGQMPQRTAAHNMEISTPVPKPTSEQEVMNVHASSPRTIPYYNFKSYAATVERPHQVHGPYPHEKSAPHTMRFTEKDRAQAHRDVSTYKPYSTVTVSQQIPHYKFPLHIQSYTNEDGGQRFGSSYSNGVRTGIRGGYGSGQWQGELQVPSRISSSYKESVQAAKHTVVPVSNPYAIFDYKSVPLYSPTYLNMGVGQETGGSHGDRIHGGFGVGHNGRGYEIFRLGQGSGYGQVTRYLSGYEGRPEGAYGNGHVASNTVTLTKEVPVTLTHPFVVRVENFSAPVTYTTGERIPYSVNVPVNVPSHVPKPVFYPVYVPVSVPVSYQYKSVYFQPRNQDNRGYDGAYNGRLGGGYSGFQGRGAQQTYQIPWTTYKQTPTTSIRQA